MGSWFRRLIGPLAIILFLALAVIAQQSQPTTQPAQAPASGSLEAEGANNSLSPEAEDKLIREVRHELIMLPYYNVFDNLSFKVDGRTVVLEGQVTKPVLKTDAGNVVKRIEGVDKVINNIQILPPSPFDTRVREQTYAALSRGPLSRYFWEAAPSIHIIVKNQRVTLKGIVNSEGDKNLATIQANTVPGVFQVTNELRVVK